MTPLPYPLDEILDLARWAPSGDNTQPWRFEVINQHRLIVHAHDTRDHCVYDLDGHASQIAHGALLETLAIAASAHGLRMEFTRSPDAPESNPDYLVKLTPDSTLSRDPLVPYIPLRSVQRRPLRTTPLTQAQKQALEDAVGKSYSVLWFESPSDRWRMAKLMFSNARLRLTLPEAYPTHRDVIQWNARFSEDKVPDQAIGLDRVTLKLMPWVMKSWQRVEFFNTYLAGTLAPRIQMDLIPGLLCAAHCALLAQQAPRTIDDYVAAGRAIQRFWLMATSLGLQLQPEMTPLIFGHYVHEHTTFSRLPGMAAAAAALRSTLARQLGGDQADRAVFLARVGSGNAARSRSLRLPVQKLRRRA